MSESWKKTCSFTGMKDPEKQYSAITPWKIDGWNPQKWSFPKKWCSFSMLGDILGSYAVHFQRGVFYVKIKGVFFSPKTLLDPWDPPMRTTSTTQLSTSASFWHACKASVNGLSSRSCTHPGLGGGEKALAWVSWVVGWLELVGWSWLVGVGLLGAGWKKQQSILKGFQKKCLVESTSRHKCFHTQSDRRQVFFSLVLAISPKNI